MSEASDVDFGVEVTKGVVAKFAMAVIGFVGTIIFARILGPAAFGGFYLLYSLSKVANLPVTGVALAAKKRFSETAADRQEILGGLFAIILSSITLVFGGAFLGRAWLSSYSGLEGAAALFGLLFVVAAIFGPFQDLLTATGRVSLPVWIDFLRSMLTTPLQLLFVLLELGAAGMVYGLSLATLLTFPLNQYFLRTQPRMPGREVLTSLWKYARHSVVSATLRTAYDRFDVLLLGFILTPAAAGLYEVAFKLTLPAIFLAEVAGSGLMARVSNLDSKAEPVGPDITNTLSFSSLLAVPMFFGALALSESVVTTFYGPAYAAAGPLLIGLALYRLVQTQTDPLEETLNGLDRPDIPVRIGAVALLTNISLGVALTLEFGPIGVVAATALAEIIRYVGSVVAVKSIVAEGAVFPRTLLEQGSAATVMLVVVEGVHQLVPVKSWLHLSFLLAVGGVVYGGVLFSISQPLRVTVYSILRDSGVWRVLSSISGPFGFR